MWRSYSKKRAIIQQHKDQWSAYHKQCKDKRKDNYKKSLKILQDANIAFTEHANKSIYILTEKGKVIFHPTTGSFYGVQKGRGIFELIQKIL
jgi:hypothetical protein